MEHVAALLLIIGCSGDLKQCGELPARVPLYETAEECASALPFALQDWQGRKPRVFARCVPVDPAMEEEDAQLAWSVSPEGGLTASVYAAEPDAVAMSGF
ncbi:hypothetical protein [Mesorhizobium sp. KR2-14]|uniref:hypothetical protein n=1 Tax=Mesorhizobium sp. KR2-14 TaxID=3156610 RepID=UPI0032B57044